MVGVGVLGIAGILLHTAKARGRLFGMLGTFFSVLNGGGGGLLTHSIRLVVVGGGAPYGYPYGSYG